MLSSLPTELIREIIESTVPHTFHSTTYQERQRTLCSLSLVSKLFRSIAQPLLLEIVWIESTSEIDRLPLAGTSRSGEHGRAVRCAVVDLSRVDEARSPSANIANLERALPHFQSVTTLTVTGFLEGSLDLCAFENFLDLTHLHLSGDVWSCSRPPVLPKIQSLALHALSFGMLEVLLCQTTLPNLKEFALVDAESAYLKALARPGSRQLLPQLEALSFVIDVWEDPRAAFLHPAASRTLVDCAAFELRDLSIQGPPIVNLRLCDRLEKVADTQTRSCCKDLNDYAAFISSNPALPLRRVYLDSSLEHVSSLSNQLGLTLTSFRRICQERRIDLIFDPIPRNFNIDPCFQPNFMRRRRTAQTDHNSFGS